MGRRADGFALELELDNGGNGIVRVDIDALVDLALAGAERNGNLKRSGGVRRNDIRGEDIGCAAASAHLRYQQRPGALVFQGIHAARLLVGNGAKIVDRIGADDSRGVGDNLILCGERQREGREQEKDTDACHGLE